MKQPIYTVGKYLGEAFELVKEFTNRKEALKFYYRMREEEDSWDWDIFQDEESLEELIDDVLALIDKT